MEQLTLDSFIDMSRDPLEKEVARFLVTTGRVSIGSVQRRFNLSFRRADKIMSSLAKQGVIPEEYLSTNPQAPLMTEEEYLAWIR